MKVMDFKVQGVMEAFCNAPIFGFSTIVRTQKAG